MAMVLTTSESLADASVSEKKVRVQRSGIDTIKYHT